MFKVALYSLLLIAGMLLALSNLLGAYREWLIFGTMVCLAYIMIEVGLEFFLDKKRLHSYAKDYGVAITAATFPWIFCALYFLYLFELPWQEAFLIGRFAAPTSAGVLFAMLSAAGLAATWVFKKARILAIFDDLDTILLMIPLQVLFIGLNWGSLYGLLVIFLLLLLAYRYLHQLKVPSTSPALFAYGLVIASLLKLIDTHLDLHIEVLLPAFALGCILYNPHDPELVKNHQHEHAYLEPEMPLGYRYLDNVIKSFFMFLVGCSLPAIDYGLLLNGWTLLHVVALTALSNLGKMFPAFCYRDEAPFRQRLALSIAMFPRGEVGAGVLLVASSYGLTGVPLSLAALSLALNLLLTGFFILAVIRIGGLMARPPPSHQAEGGGGGKRANR